VGRKETAELLELLRKRVLGPEGQGSRAVFLDEVRDSTGHKGKRTIDAISVGMYPSRGCLIEGYELKTSRGDWRGELNDPTKAEVIAQYCDRFWLVTAPGVVELGEVPPLWGHLERQSEKAQRLICRREPQPLPAVESPERHFIAAMLRRAVKQDVNREVKARAEAAESDARAQVDRELNRARESANNSRGKLEKYEAAFERFEEATGMSLNRWMDTGDQLHLVGELAALFLPGRHDVPGVKAKVKETLRAAKEVQGLLEKAEKILDEHGVEAKL
jgi:hypothetical protein